MPSGVIIEGESRLRLCKKLVEEKVPGFYFEDPRIVFKLPVILIVSEPSEDVQEKLLYLGNLTRFEADLDTKLKLFAKIWPGYFESNGKPGRPSASQEQQTATEVADAMGLSTRQVRLNKKIIQTATADAKSEGRAEPTVEDIANARQADAARRARKAKLKAKAAPPAKPKPSLPVLDFSRAQLQEVLSVLTAAKPTPLRKQLIAKIGSFLKAKAR
jgi:hypothetical protein